MAKKKQQPRETGSKKDDGAMTLADALGDSVLAKLKAAKSELSEEAAQAEEQRRQQAVREQKEREANKSFGELLDEYDWPAGK
ncbi:YqkE family protein [Sporosarcina sp. NCCP-2716]|uniref:YqkE family protein n=1 Tax=Sporosarcina sp. NCCP-2716 TaxID=2943679 RepID=UPI002041F2A1|nr:YqkE family protein [Sporosarcina sp. NCCP-2716]